MVVFRKSKRRRTVASAQRAARWPGRQLQQEAEHESERPILAAQAECDRALISLLFMKENVIKGLHTIFNKNLEPF